jgi:hypothetical protein
MTSATETETDAEFTFGRWVVVLPIASVDEVTEAVYRCRSSRNEDPTEFTRALGYLRRLIAELDLDRETCNALEQFGVGR